MELDQNTELLIRMRLTAFVNSLEPDRPGVRSVAKRIDALPVYESWSGFLAIRPDGAVLYHDQETGNTRIESDPLWVRIALRRAAITFPELSHLMPRRPANGIDCDQCHGTGDQAGAFSEMFLCKCGGLGWLSSLDKRPATSRLKVLWSFARGDCEPDLFKDWLCKQYADLEAELENDLFLELLGLNYSDDKAITNVRHRLRQYLRRLPGLECFCITLPNRFSRILSTPENMPELATLCSVRSRTPWLHLKHCRSCGEWWYLAADSINDDIHLQRLTDEEADKVQTSDIWPVTFDNFQEVWPSEEWLHTSGYDNLAVWQRHHGIPDADHYL